MKLFHISNNKVKVMNNRSYRDEQIKGFGEAMLEQFIVDYPEIIPAEEIDQVNPPVLLVIRNQAGVTPGSMDVLMVDNNGVPTIIEAKLVDNREISRSVLAQGLEYLSSLRNEWSPERFISEGKNFWESKSMSFLDKFEERFGFPYDDDYSQKLRANLETARMRLLIVSDRIPVELRTVIEFLNYTSAFDVFGVEVNLFAEPDTDDVILAPSIIGVSQKAIERKQSVSGRQPKETQLDKIQRIEPQSLQGIINELCDEWQFKYGRKIEFLTISAPGFFTFQYKPQNSMWLFYAVIDSKVNDETKIIHPGNSFIVSKNHRKFDNEAYLKLKEGFLALEKREHGAIYEDDNILRLTINQYFNQDDVDLLLEALEEYAKAFG